MKLERRRNRPRPTTTPQTFDTQAKSDEQSPADIEGWLDLLDRFLKLPNQHKQSIREELRGHLTERVRDLMLTGTEREFAMRQAINELGEAAELAERFRHANHYPRRRLLMNALLAGVCTTVVIGAVAVMNSNGNQSSAIAPAFYAAQEQADDQREALDSISIDLRTEMSPRDIVDAIVATKKIGVSVDWSPLEEIGLSPDEPLGMSGRELPVSMVLNELSRRLNNEWDVLDWRVKDRMLILDTRHGWDLRERIIASYNIQSIIDQLRHEYATNYNDAVEQICTVITNLVDPELWIDNGGDVGKIEVVGGRMFVQAPLRMHEKVTWILGELAKEPEMPMVREQPRPEPNYQGHSKAKPEPTIMPNPSDADRAAHARNQRAMTQLRNIHMAVQIYNQAKEKAPDSFDQLVTGGMLTNDGVKSPAGSAADGKDYWVDFSSIINPGDGVDWSKRIVGIDRSMYATGDYVAVLFADGHIELLTIARFHAMLDEAANNGVKPDLPKRKADAAAQSVERFAMTATDAQSLAPLLERVASGNATVHCDAMTNSVLVAAPEDQLSAWSDLLSRLDYASN